MLVKQLFGFLIPQVAICPPSHLYAGTVTLHILSDRSYLQQVSTGVLCHRSVIKMLCREQAAAKHCWPSRLQAACRVVPHASSPLIIIIIMIVTGSYKLQAS